MIETRKIISSERVNLFEPNVYIELLAQISGKPAVGGIETAIRAAFNANEATMSKIVLERDGTAFYENIQESGCKIFVANKDWQEVLRENEKIPFNLKQGELMRIFIMPAEKNISLLIMAHHLVGDGKSITYFVEDIMKALAGEELQYKPLRLVTKDYFGKESRLPLLLRLYPNGFNKKWRKNGRNFNWEDYYKIHETYWKNRNSQVIYENLSYSEIDKIKSNAREIGITVNSYITTAFLMTDTKNSVVGFAVNARTDSNRSMSNQTTGIKIEQKYLHDLSFAENAKLVHKKIYQKLSKPAKKNFVLQFMPLLNPSLIDSVLLNKYGLYQNIISEKLTRIMGYSNDTLRHIGITNLTKLDIAADYGEYRIENILFIPPVVSYAKRIMGICTTESGMTISYHLMSDMNEKVECEFFGRAIQNIRERNKDIV